MTKTIKIVRKVSGSDDCYCFLNEQNEIMFSVPHSTKTIKGKDLYEKVYKTEGNDVVEVTIDQSELSIEDQKSFGSYVLDLFKSIDDCMKTQFAEVNK